jgi:hypothetical protein
MKTECDLIVPGDFAVTLNFVTIIYFIMKTILFSNLAKIR